MAAVLRLLLGVCVRVRSGPRVRRIARIVGAALAFLLGEPRAHASEPLPNLTSLAPYVPVATDLKKARGVAVAPSGDIYVADEHDGRIYEFAAGGATRVVASGLKRPQGVAVEDAAHLLVLAEKLPPEAEGVKGALMRVDIATGAVSVLASGLKEPRGLFRLPDGRVYVTAKKLVEEGADEKGLVLLFTEGQPLEIVASGFKEPDGIIVGADGSLVVAAERYGKGPTRLDGSLFAVDPAGDVSVLVSENLKDPGGLAADATGALFLAARRGGADGGAIVRRPQSGVPNDLATGLHKPAGLAFAPNGDLVAADFASGIVWRFQAPAPPTVNAPDPAYTNQNPFTLTGTAAAGALVTVTGGSAPATTTADADGAWSASIPLAENADNSLTVTAVDAAGKGLASAAATLHLVHDGIAPLVAAVPDRPPNAAGWYNADVVVSFTCSDPGSGVASCPPTVTVATEGAAQAVSGTATDRAGNTATAMLTINLDKTSPQITAAPFPLPNANGWYSDDVTVAFVCSDVHLSECPSPVTVTSEGADQPVTGTARDLADNTAAATLNVSIDRTPPTLDAQVAPSANAAGWNRTDVTVHFEAQDVLSGVASVTPDATLSAEGAGQMVSGAAVDRAGNVATADAVVSIDKTAPELAITAPAEGTVRRVPRVDVTGTATDVNGIALISVDGTSVSVVNPWSAEVELTEGLHAIAVEARDVADNTASASVNVAYSAPPVVDITLPEDLTAVGATPITVSGTVDDPDATIVVGLERIPAVVSGGTFTATGVPLREGGNVLTAVATDTLGNAGSDAITVVLDTTAPRVVIDSPPDGSATTAEVVTVSGNVNDIVIGTVNTAQAQVTVNGIPATVSHRSFVVENVPLALGPNTLTAVARDAVGNADTFAATVIREAATGPRLEAVSGSGQTAGIRETLPEPLIVSVVAADGTPLAGRTAVFRVAENDGTLNDGSQTASGLALTTDAQGRAQVRFTVGSRAGAGNNRVEVTSPGIEGAAVFIASAQPHPPAKVNLDSGNNQKGVVGQPLPRPFVVVVTDEGHNRLTGVPVTFTVVAGDGSFNGAESVAVTTDSDGRALTVLALGPRPGVENNVVEARVENLSGLPAGFSASAFEPGDPAETRISGVVLDNANVPVPGVTLRIRGTALATAADAQGQFALTGVPVGNVHLVVDGSTAQRAGTWPHLEYELVTVAGADNTLGMPIYLLPLDTANGIFVDETQGGTLTLPEYPGFSLTVAPGSAFFPDGTRHGTITVTAVHPDKVPMVPNFGQQPRFIVTIQPPGVRFDPPAQVTHPNVDGLPPGAKTELYSFDHDMGSFVATGTATVSPDGSVIRSDPGSGVFKGGWHCGGDPALAGTVADCPDCQVCNGVRCVAVPDGSAPRGGRVPGNCLREFCNAGQVVYDSVNVDMSDHPPGRLCCARGLYLCGPPGCIITHVNTYDSATECCDADVPVSKSGIIQDLAKCPQRVPRTPVIAHQHDGCSLPYQLIVAAGISLGITDKDNPAGGNATQFSNLECQTQGVNCTGACDIHDECYQECNTHPNARTDCDERFHDDAHNTCLIAYFIDSASCLGLPLPDSITCLAQALALYGRCKFMASTYYVFIRAGGGFAFDKRQREYCQCCS